RVEAPKKKVNKSNIPVSEVVYGAMLPADVQQAVEKEFEMALQDCVMEETKDKNNVVEAYGYQLIKSSARKASTAAAAPKCCLSNVLVLKEVSHYCLGTRMICAASVYFMLLMQDLMLPIVISYVNAPLILLLLGLKEEVSAANNNGVSTASTNLVLSELVNTARRKVNTADGQSC
ncbi:heat shock 70 kDa protein 15-like protein, partial [Tanacetum coccineum]